MANEVQWHCPGCAEVVKAPAAGGHPMCGHCNLQFDVPAWPGPDWCWFCRSEQVPLIKPTIFSNRTRQGYTLSLHRTVDTERTYGGTEFTFLKETVTVPACSKCMSIHSARRRIDGVSSDDEYMKYALVILLPAICVLAFCAAVWLPIKHPDLDPNEIFRDRVIVGAISSATFVGSLWLYFRFYRFGPTYRRRMKGRLNYTDYDSFPPISALRDQGYCYGESPVRS